MKNKLFLSFSLSLFLKNELGRIGISSWFRTVWCVCGTRMTPENRPLVFLSSFVGIKNPFFYY